MNFLNNIINNHEREFKENFRYFFFLLMYTQTFFPVFLKCTGDTYVTELNKTILL